MGCGCSKVCRNIKNNPNGKPVESGEEERRPSGRSLLHQPIVNNSSNNNGNDGNGATDTDRSKLLLEGSSGKKSKAQKGFLLGRKNKNWTRLDDDDDDEGEGEREEHEEEEKEEKEGQGQGEKQENAPDKRFERPTLYKYASSGSSHGSKSLKKSYSSAATAATMNEDMVLKRIKAHKVVFSKGFAPDLATVQQGTSFNSSVNATADGTAYATVDVNGNKAPRRHSAINYAEVNKSPSFRLSSSSDLALSNGLLSSSNTGSTNRSVPSQVVPKDENELKALIQALWKCYLFADNSVSQTKQLAQFMWREVVNAGDVVVQQGEQATEKQDYFYVIRNGVFEFFVDDESQGRRDANAEEPFFGELALLYDSPRGATVKCIESGTLWAIDRKTFRHVIAASTMKSREEKKAAVLSIPLLRSGLTDEQMNRVIESVEIINFKPKQRIVRKGDKGDICYFIKSGSVRCTRIGPDELGVVDLKPGDYFGERALLREEPRAADVTTESEVEAMAIDRYSFNELLGPLRAIMDDNMKGRVVEALPILQQLTDEKREMIVNKFKLEKFADRQEIVRQGEVGDKFFVVRLGQVEVLSGGSNGSMHESATYDRDTCDGAQKPEASIPSAVTESGSHDTKFSSSGSHVREMQEHDQGQEQRQEQGQEQRQEQRQEQVSAKANGSNDSIHDTRTRDSTGSPLPAHVSRPHSGTLAILQEGDWFGEMALLNNDVRVATCIARGDVECFVLSREDFELLKGSSSLLEATSAKRQEMNEQLEERGRITGIGQFDLDEFEKLRTLGKGTFGTVYLVRAQLRENRKQGLHEHQYGAEMQHANETIWALKTMSKKRLMECEQQTNVMNEKNVMMEIQHPFMMTLIKTFQDRDCLYMLLDFVQGGELFTIMQDKYRLPLGPTRFYTACIIDAFAHLHKRNIVYRDLKPENVLVDRQGYVRLADFGFAKRVLDKTFTLCGTPEYLAPEVVLGRGHDKGVDYWGIGVLIYEMLVGISPFADEYEADQVEVCNRIIRGPVDLEKMREAAFETLEQSDPDWNAEVMETEASLGEELSEAEDILQRLLTKSSNQRLGCLRDGADGVRYHPFYSRTYQDWSLLRRKKYPAPFIPSLANNLDTSRFDDLEDDIVYPEYTGNNDWCADF